MQPLVVGAVVLATVVSGSLVIDELFCQCRVWHYRDYMLSLHCFEQKDRSPGVSCKEATVPEVPRGYQYVSGYALVRLYRTFKNWTAARQTCEADGSRLAVPPDRYAMDGLKQLFAQEKGVWYAYLGISDEISEGVFVGVNGRPAPYLNWEPNNPDNKDGKENCVTVRNDGLMNDLGCDWVCPFFCERSLTVGVPDTYRWLEEAGRFYKVHKEKLVQHEAAEVCRSENATLAVTDTWQRGEAVLRLFEATNDVYLIGFDDRAVEGDFVTETGRHLNDMEFKVWGPREPNNNDGGKDEDCLALSARGYYNDVRCELPLPFICEILPK